MPGGRADYNLASFSNLMGKETKMTLGDTQYNTFFPKAVVFNPAKAPHPAATLALHHRATDSVLKHLVRFTHSLILSADDSPCVDLAN